MNKFSPAFALLLMSSSIALLASCESDKNVLADPPSSEVPATAARVSGVVRDDAGNPVAGTKVHVYEGSDSTQPSRVVPSGDNGAFQVDVKPGHVRLFVEQPNVAGREIDLGSLQAKQSSRFDSLRLGKILSGTIAFPGLVDGSAVIANVEGSPLAVSVGADGTVSVKIVDGQEFFLNLKVSLNDGGVNVIRHRIHGEDGRIVVAPCVPDLPPVEPVRTTQTTIDLHPSPNEVDETILIGNFAGTSTHQKTNYGLRTEDGLGGAYDGNTIGRLLWHYRLPDSLQGKNIQSARLVFPTLRWGIRPTGGQDLTIEAHRMLKPWKEGFGTDYGSEASLDNDGATAAGPSYGKSWNKPLVGLDGVDAEVQTIARATLPYLSTQPVTFDVTTSVKDWIRDPATNFGLLFRSVNEGDGLYLDYPAFGTDDNSDPNLRPYLELVVSEDGPGAVSGPYLVLQPGPEGQDDAILIGTFTGTGTHDGRNQGNSSTEGLGGAWDANTVGRLLWKIALPDSLKSKTIVSAQAVFKVSSWQTRPVPGRDLKIEAHRLLKDWNEGVGTFPGSINSASIDGATSLGPRYGIRWHRPLVGLDGVDAEASPSAYSVLPLRDTTSMAFDFTELVKKWLDDPSTNHGVIFRSLDEMAPDYPDYPGFYMSEATNPSLRPKLVLRFK